MNYKDEHEYRYDTTENVETTLGSPYITVLVNKK